MSHDIMISRGHEALEPRDGVSPTSPDFRNQVGEVIGRVHTGERGDFMEVEEAVLRCTPLVESASMAMYEAAKEVGWLTELLGDLGSDLGTALIPVGDSQGRTFNDAESYLSPKLYIHRAFTTTLHGHQFRQAMS